MTFQSTFKVGRFTCDMSFSFDRADRFKCEWSPHLPKHGQLSKKDLAHYQRCRNRLMEEVAKATGQRILVVE
jgi:hypothetical protein